MVATFAPVLESASLMQIILYRVLSVVINIVGITFIILSRNLWIKFLTYIILGLSLLSVFVYNLSWIGKAMFEEYSSVHDEYVRDANDILLRRKKMVIVENGNVRGSVSNSGAQDILKSRLEKQNRDAAKFNVIMFFATIILPLMLGLLSLLMAIKNFKKARERIYF